MREQSLAVRRTARYWVLGEAGPAVRQVWFACHGYGQLAGRFLARFRILAHPSRLIIAPEALSRFYLDGGTGPHTAQSRVGATWMTREDRLNEIEDYIHYLDTLHDHILAGLDGDGLEVIVLGFSQGVATAARWASRKRNRIDHIVLWAGGFPPELEPQPDLFRGARLTFVRGQTDAFAHEKAVAALRARIQSGGLGYEEIVFPGGHELDDDVLLRVAGATPAPRPG